MVAMAVTNCDDNKQKKNKRMETASTTIEVVPQVSNKNSACTSTSAAFSVKDMETIFTLPTCNGDH